MLTREKALEILKKKLSEMSEEEKRLLPQALKLIGQIKPE